MTIYLIINSILLVRKTSQKFNVQNKYEKLLNILKVVLDKKFEGIYLIYKFLNLEN